MTIMRLTIGYTHDGHTCNAFWYFWLFTGRAGVLR